MAVERPTLATAVRLVPCGNLDGRAPAPRHWLRELGGVTGRASSGGVVDGEVVGGSAPGRHARREAGSGVTD
jgi:hypothetical protein